MKKQFNYLFVIICVCFIIPQIAFASWWNPFTWNIWHIFSKPQVITTSIPLEAPNLQIDKQNTKDLISKNNQVTGENNSQTNKITEPLPIPKPIPTPISIQIPPTPTPVPTPTQDQTDQAAQQAFQQQLQQRLDQSAQYIMQGVTSDNTITITPTPTPSTIPLTVSCSASSFPPMQGRLATFTASASGGDSVYYYSWSGNSGLNLPAACINASTNPTCSITADNSSQKTMDGPTVKVESGGQIGVANCSSLLPVPNGSATVVNGPIMITNGDSMIITGGNSIIIK